MNLSQIYGNWEAYSISHDINISENKLREVNLSLQKSGIFCTNNTSNSCDGEFVITSDLTGDNFITGTIRFSNSSWTKRSKKWDNVEEQQQSDTLDEFIRDFCNDICKFTCKLTDNILILTYKNTDIYFKSRNIKLSSSRITDMGNGVFRIK